MKKLLFMGIIFLQSIVLFGQVKVFNGGNVSVGSTSTAIEKLHVFGNIFIPNGNSLWIGNNGDSGDRLRLHHTSTSAYIDYATGPLYIRAGISEKVTFLASGNVGIGDNTPSALFTVGYNDLFQVVSTGHTRTIDGTAGAPSFSFTSTTNMGMYKSGTNQLSFATGGTERIHIHSDGNVGLGASVPGQKLEVNGNALVNGADKRFYIANTNRYVGMASSSDLGLINKEQTWLRIASGSGIALFSNQAGAETATTGFKMFIDANGVGIGGGYAYSPYPLVVYGSALAYGGTWQASDVQFKDDITTIISPLTLLNQISGKKYKYKTAQFPNLNFPTGYTYGVLAQDLNVALPELVQVDGMGYQTVNYIGLIPILIEAVKEQQQQIIQLQNDLAICCLSPKSNQKSINDGNSDNETQGNIQDIDTKRNNSENPKLYQNTPNPFNTRTEIKYYLPEKSIKAAILIFDMQGKLLKTNNLMNKGNGSLEIFGGEFKSGMYMYSLIIDGKEIDTKKMILTD